MQAASTFIWPKPAKPISLGKHIAPETNTNIEDEPSLPTSAIVKLSTELRKTRKPDTHQPKIDNLLKDRLLTLVTAARTRSCTENGYVIDEQLSLDEALDKYKEQNGCCSKCNKEFKWADDHEDQFSGITDKKKMQQAKREFNLQMPTIARIDVTDSAHNSYSGNFSFLCRACNTIKSHDDKLTHAQVQLKEERERREMAEKELTKYQNANGNKVCSCEYKHALLVKENEKQTIWQQGLAARRKTYDAFLYYQGQHMLLNSLPEDVKELVLHSLPEGVANVFRRKMSMAKRVKNQQQYVQEILAHNPSYFAELEDDSQDEEVSEDDIVEDAIQSRMSKLSEIDSLTQNTNTSRKRVRETDNNEQQQQMAEQSKKPRVLTENI